MRLFVAIELPETVKQAIVAIQKRIAPAAGGGAATMRWTRPEQMHLTLAFIGNVDQPRSTAVVHALSPPIDAAPFAIALEGLGVFPARGAPRILWLGVTDGARDLIRVQRHVAGRLATAGVTLEARPYHPHVTLARWKSSPPADAQAIDGVQSAGGPIRAGVDRVTLFESRQSPAGSVYTPVAATRLTGADSQNLQ
jgi:RNA 2',3'-cyclic 3'-phosphodiesterase